MPPRLNILYRFENQWHSTPLPVPADGDYDLFDAFSAFDTFHTRFHQRSLEGVEFYDISHLGLDAAQPFDPQACKEDDLLSHSLNHLGWDPRVLAVNCPGKYHIFYRASLKCPAAAVSASTDDDPLLPFKRRRIFTEAPSTFAAFQSYRQIQSNPSERLLDDRPAFEEGCAPIELLYRGFGGFLDIMQGREPIPLARAAQLEKKVAAFAEAMQKIYGNEDARRDEVLPLFSSALKAAGSPYYALVAHTGSCTNGHQLGEHGGIVVNVEFKNEITTGSAIPSPHGAAYVARSHKIAMTKHPALFGGWRVPALTVSIVGPSIQFSALCFLGQYRQVELTDALRTTFHAGNVDVRRNLRLAFAAAGSLLTQMQQDIIAFIASPPPPILPVSHRMFPDIKSIPAIRSNDTITFTISAAIAPFPNQFVYEAHTPQPNGTKVVVKFTRKYCAALHQLCESLDFAPKLYGCATLPGGWTAVVMEYVEGKKLAEAPKDELQRARVRCEEKLQRIHEAGFVHGDLRAANILHTGDSHEVLLDYDWGGKVEEKPSYPTALLNPDLTDGRRREDLIIRQEDDRRILGATFDSMLLDLRTNYTYF
ncbi:hypothetical protein C8R45DRAFT_1020860 [Mycena sanguinolenta]|nr:hypothetical protein C8R45DRAFT_1020860 [Mycena sanguinolenta]